MYYRPCPYCGAHLDPGEPCDCLEKKKENNKNILAAYRSGRDGQMEMKLEELLNAGHEFFSGTKKWNDWYEF